ncbi:hypothetical protein ABFO60_18135 [Acinetobacter baumannii]
MLNGWLKKKLEKNIKSDKFHTYFYRRDFNTYKKIKGESNVIYDDCFWAIGFNTWNS